MTHTPQPLKLSPKEEAFCLAIVEGHSKSDAYRKAYKPKRAKAKTIHEKASRIMARARFRQGLPSDGAGDSQVEESTTIR